MLLAVGEAAAGKASRSLAQHIPGQAGMEGMKVAASGAVGELARARIALDERGQRLGELEERTALMMTSAETFSKHAHEVKTTFISKMLSHQNQKSFNLDSGCHNYEKWSGPWLWSTCEKLVFWFYSEISMKPSSNDVKRTQQAPFSSPHYFGFIFKTTYSNIRSD